MRIVAQLIPISIQIAALCTLITPTALVWTEAMLLKWINIAAAESALLKQEALDSVKREFNAVAAFRVRMWVNEHSKSAQIFIQMIKSFRI